MSLLRAAYVAFLFGTLTIAAPAALAATDNSELRASGGSCDGASDDESLALSFVVGCTALARRSRRS